MKDKNLKFEDYPFRVPTEKRTINKMESLIKELEECGSALTAKLAVKHWNKYMSELSTDVGVISVRYSLDTRNKIYKNAQDKVDELSPVFSKYSNDKDADRLFAVLNTDYKNEHNIHSAADFVFTQEVDGPKLTYNARLMCQKKLDIGIYSFYVSGFESNENKVGRLDNRYYEVILNDNNFTFNIRPIDEKTFGGECHE